MASPIGMSNDSALRVYLPPSSSQANEYSAEQSTRTRKAPVVGCKIIDSATSSLKSSMRLREFHLYLSNFELDPTGDKMRNSVELNSMAERIFSCDTVHSKRIKEEKTLAAPVVIKCHGQG